MAFRYSHGPKWKLSAKSSGRKKPSDAVVCVWESFVTICARVNRLISCSRETISRHSTDREPKRGHTIKPSERKMKNHSTHTNRNFTSYSFNQYLWRRWKTKRIKLWNIHRRIEKQWAIWKDVILHIFLMLISACYHVKSTICIESLFLCFVERDKNWRHNMKYGWLPFFFF